MAKTYLWVLGVVFLLVGVLGWIPNPLVGPDALFETNVAHNLVHIISGLLFVGTALYALDKAGSVLKVFGAVYLVVALLGFLTVPEGGALLGIVLTNPADHFLHVLLGVVILGLGFMVKSNQASGPMSNSMNSPM